MSGPIKPHHVTINDVEKVLAAARARNGDGVATLAAMLNEAVELGLVSPPCYCLRWNGELQTHDPGLMEDMVKIFPGKPWANDCEHWKGQTS